MKELYASKMRTPNGRSSMLKQITIGLLLTGYLAAETFVVAAQTGPPQRKVEGNTITSTIDPAAKIQLLNSPVYVGADRWILYGLANCELHAFVQADAQKKVQRLYWVQFESYLPTRPELHHMYDSPRHTLKSADSTSTSTPGSNQPASTSSRIPTWNTSTASSKPTATSCLPE
jgi:hypothetical protein